MTAIKAKHTVTTVLAVLVLLASLFAVAAPVRAGDATELTELTVTDVGELYAAVYDESGEPRDNVTIFLEPGFYELDPSMGPDRGRLVLGDGTVLYSTLRMAVDDNGVPLVDDSFQPTVLQEGAKILGWGVAADPEKGPAGPGIIVVGDRGEVRQLWIDGGNIPGAEVTSRGRISQVLSTNHSIGLRVRAATKTAQGTLEGNVTAGNWLAGLSVISTDQYSLGPFDPPQTNRTVRAILLRNTSVNNGLANLATYGGVGTDKNVVHVKAFYNHFRAGPMASPFSANVRIVGGQDFLSRGAHDNKVEFVSVGNVIAGSDFFGLAAIGGQLQDVFSNPNIDPEVRRSWDNEVVVTISDTVFENNQWLDVLAIGSAAYGPEPGGQPNTATVFVDAESLYTQALLCDFPSIPPVDCPSLATISPYSD